MNCPVDERKNEIGREEKDNERGGASKRGRERKHEIEGEKRQPDHHNDVHSNQIHLPEQNIIKKNCLFSTAYGIKNSNNNCEICSIGKLIFDCIDVSRLT